MSVVDNIVCACATYRRSSARHADSVASVRASRVPCGSHTSAMTRVVLYCHIVSGGLDEGKQSRSHHRPRSRIELFPGLNPDMLLRLRSAWGLAGLQSGDRRRLMAGLRAGGWDGVEASLADIGTCADERKDCCAAAQAEGVSLILSAYSSWPNYTGPFDASSSVRDHTAALTAELHQIADLVAASSPGGGTLSPIVRVNAHSGSDAWTEAEAVEYFEEVAATLAAPHAPLGGGALPPLSHETHRGRYLCCPFVTGRLLARLPSLRLTSDFSHWVVKCERLLDTPEELALLDTQIAPAIDHVHARVRACALACPTVGIYASPSPYHRAW